MNDPAVVTSGPGAERKPGGREGRTGSGTRPRRLATLLLTAVTLVAFAANSILCRAALGGHAIDAASFALIRLASGAVMLVALHTASRREWRTSHDRVQPLALFLYAAAFAFAYLSLPAGTGALILFGAVQATMILGAIRAGERFTTVEIVGLVIALAGLGYLVKPGLAAPSPVGSGLMAAAGIAWGVYSLRGRASRDPLGDTARNFGWAVPPVLLVAALAFRHLHVSPHGATLAVASGALTSGLGYVVWFAALRGLSAFQAGIVQLAVPVIAAIGGVALLSERITLRLAISAILILGGIALAITMRPRAASSRR